MIIVPVEEITLPVIAAMNNGEVPKIDPLEHSCFIFHDGDVPNEFVPSVLVKGIMHTQGFVAFEIPIIMQKPE
jgi:hypothetical protein